MFLFMWIYLILLILLIPLIAVILDSELGRALARRLERPRSEEGTERRLEKLEVEVERLASDVQRLQLESEFLNKLVSGRPPSDRTLPGGERSD